MTLKLAKQKPRFLSLLPSPPATAAVDNCFLMLLHYTEWMSQSVQRFFCTLKQMVGDVRFIFLLLPFYFAHTTNKLYKY